MSLPPPGVIDGGVSTAWAPAGRPLSRLGATLAWAPARAWLATHAGLGALLAILLAAPLMVSPVGEFPVDDDWVYARTVQHLAADGVYQPSAWIDATFVAQAWWGAALTRVLGFSHTSLRLGTLLLAAASLFLYYLLLRRARLGHLALPVALLLVFHPLVFHLSYSFMTDVPFLALVLAALWCISRAGQAAAPRLGWLAVGWGLLGLACLVRQVGLALVPAVLLGTLPELRAAAGARWRLVAACALSFGLAAAPLLAPGAHDVTVEVRLADVLRSSDPAVFADGLALAGVRAVALLGLSAAGLSPLILGRLQPPGWSRRQRAAAAALLLLLGWLVAGRAGTAGAGLAPSLLAGVILAPAPRWLFGSVGARLAVGATIAAAAALSLHLTGSAAVLDPLFGNTLSASGLTTSGHHPQSIAVGDAEVEALATCALLGAMALILAVATQLWEAPLSIRLLALSGISVLAVTVAYAPIDRLYDRYLLPVLPGALGLAALTLPRSRLAVPVLAVGVLLLATWSVTWQRDFMQRQAAVWEVAQALVDQGIDPSAVEAGFEWDGWQRGDAAIAEARAEAIRLGAPERFVQLVVDALYRRTAWEVTLSPPPACSQPPRVTRYYGGGWPVYGLPRCAPFGGRRSQGG